MPALAGAETSQPVPDLPASLSPANAANQGKLVLLDFYSKFCGTCQRVEPLMDSLKEDFADSVVFHRVLYEDKASKPVLDRYKISGTPTYILFDAKGRPLYRMTDMISMSVLDLQLKRLTGKLEATTLPAALSDLKAEKHPGKYVFVSMMPENCKHCGIYNSVYRGIQFTQDESMDLVRLSSDQVVVSGWMKELGLKENEGFVLLDDNSRLMFKVDGPVNPQELWQYLQMVTDTGI